VDGFPVVRSWILEDLGRPIPFSAGRIGPSRGLDLGLDLDLDLDLDVVVVVVVNLDGDDDVDVYGPIESSAMRSITCALGGTRGLALSCDA